MERKLIPSARIQTNYDGLSFLESNAVAPTTTRRYATARQAFNDHVCKLGVRVDYDNTDSVETALLEYLDSLFCQGLGPDAGLTVVAALRAAYPRLSREGDMSLPRVTEAMRGWSRLGPRVAR